MPSSYKTPGVFVEEKSTLAPSVAGVATAIPAFVGNTKSGKTDPLAAVRITSFLEFEAKFGGAPEFEYDKNKKSVTNAKFVLYDSMRIFFDNGGNVCYVVSVGSYGAPATLQNYKDGIDALNAEDEVTLVLFPDAATVLGNKDLGQLQNHALAHCNNTQDRFAIFDVIDTGKPVEDLKSFRDYNGSDNLMFGAAYYPYLVTSYEHEFSVKDVLEKNGTTVDELLALEEKNPNDNTYVNEKLNIETDSLTIEDYLSAISDAKINYIKSSIPGYADSLKALQRMSAIVPPSGAVAGVIAANDAQKGVWSAPANVSLISVLSPNTGVSNLQQGDFNVDAASGKSVNVIRKFTGKGNLIWGARTLDGNSNEWKYVPVRRLFTYIEESIQKSTFWSVFQPNDMNTWVKIKSQISNFLYGLWRDGALVGASAEDAYFINVGKGITMTQDDINNGLLIVEVGIAAVRPAEFIVIRFSHKVQE